MPDADSIEVDENMETLRKDVELLKQDTGLTLEERDACVKRITYAYLEVWSEYMRRV